MMYLLKSTRLFIFLTGLYTVSLIIFMFLMDVFNRSSDSPSEPDIVMTIAGACLPIIGFAACVSALVLVMAGPRTKDRPGKD